MEAVAIIVVVLGLCVCFGVPLSVITFGFGIALVLVILLMLAMFIYAMLCMLFSKKTEGKFLRTDKNPKGGFTVAYYSVGGEEYPCMFPSEVFFSSRIYTEGRLYKIRLNRSRKCVFDKFAAATCILGFVFSLLFAVAAAFVFKLFLSL